MKPYEYRRLSPEEQKRVVAERRAKGMPRHSPPHRAFASQTYILTAACFEHAALMKNPERRAELEQKLRSRLEAVEKALIWGWCVLPNHYHVVVQGDLEQFARVLHRLHNGTSTGWNREDNTPGRQVWYRHFDRALHTEHQLYVALNYVHTNAVKHGYAARADQWPTCSLHFYLETWGREELHRCWSEYPILDFGAGWDDF